MITFEVTSTAKKAVLIANTPAFLLNRLLSDNGTQFLSESYSESELYEYLEVSLQNFPANPEELTAHCVCLVAISIIASAETWKAVHRLPLENLPWAPEIVALIDSSRDNLFTAESVEEVPLRVSSETASPFDTWDEQTAGAEPVPEVAA